MDSTRISRTLKALKTCLHRRPRINYIGYADSKNLGDFYAYQAIKKIFNEYAFTHYSDYLGKEKFLYNLYQRLCKQRLFEFNLVGGGTLIGRDQFLPLLKDCSDLADKMVSFGTGVMEPEFWSSRGYSDREKDLKTWIEYLNKFDYISVRGALSKEILSRYGIENAEVIGDPVLSLANYKVLAHNNNRRKEGKHIGINVGYANEIQWGSQEDLINCIILLAETLISQNWNISFFCVWEYDLEIIKMIKKSVGKDIAVFYDFHRLNKVFEYFSGLDIFVGEKLHSCVFSAAANVPFIMLEYRPKCRDFMQSMDLIDFSLRTDNLDVGHIVDKIDYLYKNQNTHTLFLKEKVNEYCRRQKLAAQNILNRLS